MKTNDAINFLLEKENEISNKFHNCVTEILRVGYETDRGKEQVSDMIKSVQYSLEEIERILGG